MKRDPNKTARNQQIRSIKDQRRALQSSVFAELAGFEGGKYCNELSLNAFIGSKTDDYIELKNEIIKSPMEYQSKWLKGLKRCVVKSAITGTEPRHGKIHGLLTGNNPNFKKYVALFLEGSFLKHYDEHYKQKPKLDESEYWFGNNDDEFGLLVTPRFSGGNWENDKSEIRHFKHPYWTLSHVLETGVCYMGEEKMRTFSKLSDYLQFFRDLVRRTKSKYQLDIADRYIAYVETHSLPLSVPMLIPEIRYDPFKTKHEHRLDFLIINPWNLEKYGFEFSPWSTHGKLTGAKRTMSEYNADAKANFEKEMTKHKKYWRKFGVTYIVYTDQDLADMDAIWDEMKRHLEILGQPDQLELALLSELL
ncbi:hypothetical protein JAB8_17930 [Janthinobacterium sp. HH106]|uniref:hypothetical protein n=1 Tax=Janthinobacterium sp. HH106 TaxID=1537278 RepID=UPI0008738540|nr:hypothetical protein [Janthinobacterium sp. HH106]OEZ90868.1 hypothetical protein JAB8_17930 [Janthinobacterium sp. HH106]